MKVNLIIFIEPEDSAKRRKKIIDDYNRSAERIMNEIKTFTDIQTLTYSSGTNVISLSADSKREHLKFLTNKILKIRGISNLLMFPDRIEELRDALEMHDFFKVLAYSSTLLESYGKQILIGHYNTKKGDKDRINEKIRRLSFNATVMMLYYNKIIDKPLFDDIDHVREERNIFIHKMYDQSDVLWMKKVKTMEGLSRKAIHSVSALRAKV
jgi:hypothetical protein